ncbi:MAG: hypothetical protein C0417_00165, partial [Chlorobiaceae bacterium]|nr:hypothetical protein [Chlorobiaceae bacterium]
EFLSTILEVSSSKIEIVAGHTSRNKLVSILNLNAEEVTRRISSQINSK